MGRGDKWDSRQDSSWSQSGRGWQIWPGAKSNSKGPGGPSWKKGAGKDEGEYAAARFPAYDAKPPAKAVAANGPPRDRELREATVPGDADGALVPSVQKALNGARKAEQRVAKLMKDKSRAEQQWQDYVRDSRAAYVREYERYKKAVANFDKDLQEAVETQKTARYTLRQAAIQEELQMTVAMEAEQDNAGAEWEQLVAGWEYEQAIQDDALLRRAFQERGVALGEARTPSLRRTAPRTPPASIPGTAPVAMAMPEEGGYVPMYNSSSPSHPAARVDPYPIPASPVVPAMESPLPMAGAELRHPTGTSPMNPGMAPPEGPRRGIKEATKMPPERPSVHGGISEKLETRRAAMMPFGVPPGLGVSHPGPTPIPAAHLLDDDLDDLEESGEPPEGASLE